MFGNALKNSTRAHRPSLPPPARSPLGSFYTSDVFGRRERDKKRARQPGAIPNWNRVRIAAAARRGEGRELSAAEKVGRDGSVRWRCEKRGRHFKISNTLSSFLIVRRKEQKHVFISRAFIIATTENEIIGGLPDSAVILTPLGYYSRVGGREK